MSFSERYGYTNAKDRFQIDSIDRDLSVGIWNVLYKHIFVEFHNPFHFSNRNELYPFAHSLWVNFMKLGLDLFPNQQITFLEVLKDHFKKNCEWYHKYNLIEMCVEEYPASSEFFIEDLNSILEKEQSAYRVVKNQVAKITSQSEVDSITEAQNISDTFQPVKTHLNRALELLSDRKQPDYKNSIKESISAVESLCKIIAGDNDATLGKAIKKIKDLNPTLKSAFEKLYGYTNSAGGIRHALTGDDYEVNFEEAKFMLVSCSAFVNYLIQKQANTPIKEVAVKATSK